MKKVMVLVGLLTAFTLKAETFEKTLMLDYTPVDHMDFAFEIKTSRYDKVILDCQSFVTGMNFYKDKKVVHSIYLDAYGDCQDMHNYLQQNFTNKVPVCLEVETEKNSLTVSNEAEGCL
jgi:hypothetical protein